MLLSIVDKLTTSATIATRASNGYASPRHSTKHKRLFNRRSCGNFTIRSRRKRNTPKLQHRAHCNMLSRLNTNELSGHIHQTEHRTVFRSTQVTTKINHTAFTAKMRKWRKLITSTSWKNCGITASIPNCAKFWQDRVECSNGYQLWCKEIGMAGVYTCFKRWPYKLVINSRLRYDPSMQ